ncbi:hypothetical protein D9O40_16780 [Clostridium autoethanogenum]|uniref:Uncharacterized protein n=1 Tax=Clostridium autoethanogenum TaxID=84023 RepID=A0A3M0S9P8_9CLOT|nr:hypothetical protein [Clostridium autoethanogenum]RMC95193.1 hypothetical protein D9O40_16780 [Clostridium autoethanogenum]
MEDKYIYTKSINAITYVLYKTMEELDFYVDPIDKQIYFKIPATQENSKYYYEYKDAVHNNSVLKLDLILFNQIMHEIKFQTKQFRNNLK